MSIRPGASAAGAKPLRILQLLTYYHPHRTGLTAHVRRIAEGLAARGHQVTVLSARFRAGLPREERLGEVRVVRLWSPLRVSRGMLMPSYPLALWREVRRAHVVHAHSPLLELPLVAALCRLSGRPLVITHHGDLVLPAGVFNRFVAGMVHAFYRIGAGAAAAIVAYSADYAATSPYLAPFAAKVVPLFPPVTIPEPDPVRVDTLRRRLGVGEGPVIGYSGRFVEEKRPDLLLCALRAVRRGHPAATVVFAGQHVLPYERYLERCAALIEEHHSHVRFTGLITDPGELAAFYRLCDVLVLPSESECFGLVQVEAMLCGTPVVATDIPGARVPVRETGMGVIVRPRDVEALAEGILRVLRDPAPLVRSRAEVEAVFSAADTLERYEMLLRGAAESP